MTNAIEKSKLNRRIFLDAALVYLMTVHGGGSMQRLYKAGEFRIFNFTQIVTALRLGKYLKSEFQTFLKI